MSYTKSVDSEQRRYCSYQHPLLDLGGSLFLRDSVGASPSPAYDARDGPSSCLGAIAGNRFSRPLEDSGLRSCICKTIYRYRWHSNKK